MGEEKVTTDVGDAVASGTVSPTKSNNDISEKKDGEKEGVEETRENADDGTKNQSEEDNVVQKDAEVKDSKEEGEGEKKEEAKSDAMEVDNVPNVNEQHNDKIEENTDLEEAGSKKRGTKKSGGEKAINRKATEEKKKNDEPKNPVGPIIDRPVRERKSVERLVAVIEQDNAKEFHIEKGRGSALKDIPNGVYF